MSETTTPNPVINPAQHKTLMGVLCYLGILLIIPYLMAKEDTFVHFHLRQGLVLLVLEAAAWVIGMMFMWQMYMLISIIQLAALVLSIIGIVNVVQGHEKELPLVGQFASYFKI
jgi:uncharacterized membrane protein